MTLLKLGDITDSCLGKMLDTSKNKGEYKPYLANINVRWGDFDTENLSVMRFEEDEDERYGIEEGDLIVCEGGEPGRCAIWDGSIQNMKIQKALHRVRAHSGYDIRYIYYWMLLTGKKGLLKGYFTGSTIKHLPGDKLKEIVLNVPEYSKQISIANTLSNIDKLIKNNNHINDYLEEMAKTIFDYWFVQFDFPNENGKPYKSAGGQMSFCNELNREIPLNWDYISIGNITTCLDSARIPLSNQQREKMKGSIPYYGATGVMGYVNRSIFSGDFVLLAEDGSVMDSNGKPILQRVSGDVWINNHTHVLQPANGYSCRLLYLLLKDIPVSLIKTGSIQMKINQTNLNNYNVLNIPDVIRKHFINYIEPLDIKIVQIQKENTQLKQLRDWLLPMLMNAQATIED